MKNNRFIPGFILTVVTLVAIGVFPTNAQLSNTPTASSKTRMIAKYTCSMHPEVIMDNPGKCPICGMKLVKKQYAWDGKNIQTTSIPNEVYDVFKKSCMACHGIGGRPAPSSIVNFSKWDQYKTDKQAKLAAAICDAVTNDVMPPLPFRKANPTTVLTPVQKELVCNWSKRVIGSKKNVKK